MIKVISVLVLTFSLSACGEFRVKVKGKHVLLSEDCAPTDLYTNHIGNSAHAHRIYDCSGVKFSE